MIRQDEDIGNHINKEQAENLLEQDVRKAENILHRYCNVLLTENQQAVLISFIFNCGGGAFQASTLWPKLNRGEYLNTANELLRWIHANGSVKLQGLVRRREKERSLFWANSWLNFYCTIKTSNFPPKQLKHVQNHQLNLK